MRGKLKNSYLTLLLAGVLMTGAVVAGNGTAQARYKTVAGWQLQLQQVQEEPIEIVSSVMDADGSLVKLADLNVGDVRSLKVDMKVNGGTANGTLYCTPSNEYLYATCLESIHDESEQEFTILLTPSEEAEALTEPTPVTVRVEWNNALWARLEVMLLPAEHAEEDTSGLTQEEGNAEAEAEAQEESAEVLSEEGENTLPMAEGFLAGMDEFDPKELLGLEITVPQRCDSVCLTYNGGTFPEFTRYSTDGGESYILLYDAGVIELETGSQEKILLLLDFENSSFDGQAFTVTGEAFLGDESLGTASVNTKPSGEIPQLEQTQQPIILTADRKLTLELPMQLGGAQTEFYLRRLGGSEDALAVLSTDENGHLVISAVDKEYQAKAGTYLLDIMWKYQDMTVAQRRLTFYINYSAYVQTSNADTAEDIAGGNEL